MNLKKKKGIRVSQKFWKKETLYKKDSIDKNIRIEQKSTIERKGGRKRIGSHNPSFLSSCQNLFDQVVHTRMTRVKKKKGTEARSKGNSRFIVCGRYSFIYRIRWRTRIEGNGERQKRIQVSKPFYFSVCRHCFFREKKACRLGIKRARCALTQALSPSPNP